VTATAPDTTARSGPTAVEPVKLLGDLGNIVLTDPPKVTIEIAVAARPDPSQQVAATTTEGRGEPPVLTIRPGQTIKAKVKATRHNFEGRIEVGKGTDAGRNLPFGVLSITSASTVC